MTLGSAFFIILTVFATSTLSGVFGMVGGMVLLWFLLWLMPLAAAIAIQGFIQMTANISRAFFSRAYIDWRIAGFAVIGLIIAALLLVMFAYEPDLAIISIAIGLLPIAVWIPRSWYQLDASRPSHAILCGFLAGGLNIGVGVSGATVDLFFIRTQMDRRTVIATKATLQVLSHAIKIIFYVGSITALTQFEIGVLSLAAPLAIAGTSFGHAILQRLTDHEFRKWTRLLVTVIGVFYFIQGCYILWNAG